MSLHQRPTPEPPPTADFDFYRYGRYLLIIAAVVGVYLSRHCGDCFMVRLSQYSPGGETDSATESGLIGEGGNVKSGTEGDYADSIGEGAGFYGYLKDGTIGCAQRSTFSDPKPAYYVFLGALGLGILFMILNKVLYDN